jgi:hypothetical protein
MAVFFYCVPATLSHFLAPKQHVMVRTKNIHLLNVQLQDV